MNFYQAWDEMRKGQRVTIPGRSWMIGTIAGPDIHGGEQFIQYGEGYQSGWTPHKAELLADDWQVVEPFEYRNY